MVLDLVKMEPKKIDIKTILIILIVLMLVITMSICSFFIVQNHIKLKQQTAQIEQKIINKQNTYTHYNMLKPNIKQTQNIVNQINSIYNSDEKRVFLTFDDGPSKSVTPLILDLLKQENIKATFFLLGNGIEKNPQLVKRQYEEGHYVTNHGYSHVYSLIYESPQTVIEEYNKTEEAIRKAIEKPDYNSYLFRFPGGTSGGKYKKIKQEAKNILEQNGIAHIDWNALTADAEGKNTIEEMLEYAKQTIGNKKSVVILMHDAGDKILTYQMLPELISYLRQQGYSFKNMYDLVE